MLKKINNYINDNEFILNLYKEKLHINNYIKLISLEDNYISLITNKNKIIIKGENLLVVKILDNELLIKGKIINIEVIDE